MSRIANAKLVLDIEDDKLDPHIQRVKEAKASWEALGSTFQEIMGGDMNALKGLMAAFSTELSKVASATGKMKLEPMAAAVGVLDSVLGGLNPKLSAFVNELNNAAPIVERITKATGTWSKSLQTVSSVIARLEERLESLTTAQMKGDKHLDDFATRLIATNEALKTQGQEILKVLQQYAGFNKAVDDAAKKQAAAAKSSRSWWEGLRDIERAFIRHSTVIFILQNQVESLLDAFTAAATQADLGMVLGRSLPHFNELMEETRAATRGMVSDLKMMQSAALMSSFGLPIEKFAKNMELVQKLAIRTGQSTDYLMDSFGRGIARLSPAILDNLGLQIKLKDAYEAYAAGVGKATEALSAQEKKAAVMNEVLRQATELTSEVDPAASMAGRIEQARARITNVFNDIKEGILDFFVNITASKEEKVGMLSGELALLAKNLREVGHATADSIDEVADKLSNTTLHDMWRMFSGETLPDAKRTAFMKEFERATRSITDFSQKGDSDAKYRTFTIKDVELVQKMAEKMELILHLAPQAADKVKELAMNVQNFVPEDRMRDLSAAQRAYNEDPFDEDAQEELKNAKAWVDYYTAEIPRSQAAYKKASDEFIALADTWQQLIALGKDLPKVAQSLFPDDKAGQAAYTQNMMDAIDTAQKEIRSKANSGVLDGIADYFAAWKARVEPQIIASTKLMAEKSAAANKAQLQRLANLDYEVELVQMLAGNAKGLTDNEVLLSLQKKEVNKLQSEYNQMHEKLIILNAEEGKYTVDELAAKKDMLDKEYRRLAVMEAQVEFEKEFAKALNDTSVLSKDLRQSEAERLANNKTRNELEAEYLNLRISLAIATDELSVAAAHYYEILAMGTALEADLANEELEEAQRKLDAIKADIIENRNRLAAMRKPSGGGGGRGKGEKEHGSESVTEDFNQFLSDVTVGGSLALREIERRVKFTFDKITGQLIGKEELFNRGTLDLLTPNLMSPGIGKDVEGAFKHNEEILEQLDEFQAKGGKVSDETAAWADNVRNVNNELREHLNLMLAIGEAAVDAAVGIKNAFAGGDELIGEDWLNALDGLQQGFTGVADAAAANADAYGLVTAALPALRGFTKEFIKDLRLRAFFEMMMNTAAAWAAYPNVPKMVAHGTAALLYGAIAGGVVKLPSKATKETDKDDDKKNKNMSPINVYLYGEMIMSEGQMGVMVEQGVQQARAEGRL